MYEDLSKTLPKGERYYPGFSQIIPSLAILKNKYDLEPHVVIQKFGDLIAAGPNTFHLVFCEVMIMIDFFNVVQDSSVNVSQNILLPTEEQLELFLADHLWDMQAEKALNLEEVLWNTAKWIHVSRPTPPLITPAYCKLLKNHLLPYYMDFQDKKAKVCSEQ